MPKFVIKVQETGASKAEKNIKGLNKSLGGLAKKAGIAAGIMGGAFLVAAKKGIDLAAQQELAEKKLSAAYGKNIDGLKSYAEALQQQTMFGDEAIMESQALLAAFIKDEEGMKAATKATLDLAAAKGMDLKAAADLVGKTIGSSTNAMSRYGIEVVGAANSTERLESLTGNVGKLFGGQAAEQTKTMAGAMAQMKNAIGDAGEQLGFIFAPAVSAGAKAIKSLAESTGGALKFMGNIDWAGSGTAIMNNAGIIGQALLDTFKVYLDFLPDFWKNAFNKIWPAIKGALTFLYDGIKIFGQTLFDPLFFGAQLISAKIDNKFIEVFNGLKQQYNKFAEFFGMNTLDMTELIDTAGLKEKFEGTTLVSLVMGAAEDNITSGEEALEATGEIWSKALGQMVVFKEEVENIGNDLTEPVKKSTMTTEKLISQFWKNSSSDQKKAIKGQARAFTANMQNMAKAFPEAEKAAKRAAQIQAVVDTYASANAAYKAMAGIPVIGPGLGIAAAAAAIGAGLSNVKQIEKAATGADFVTSGPQMLMVGDNPSGQEHVSVTPLGGDPNLNGPQGGGINITFSGNINTADFIEQEAIPAIREAIRRGEDIGLD